MPGTPTQPLQTSKDRKGMEGEEKACLNKNNIYYFKI
jgi:hypothetical protein